MFQRVAHRLNPVSLARRETLATLAENALKTHKLPAVAVGYASWKDKSSPVEFAHAVAGSRVAGSNTLAQETDTFHLGSCTKAFTASLISEYVSEGKLSWDTKVGDVFPDALHQWHTVTLQELLAHRSGISDGDINGFKATNIPQVVGLFRDLAQGGVYVSAQKWWKPFFLEEQSLKDLPLEERIKITREARLLTLLSQATPTKRGNFSYSNYGTALAACMAEKIVQEPYERAMKRLIFDPLGMSSGGFGSPDQVCDPTAPNQPWGHFNSTTLGISVKLKAVSKDEINDEVPELLAPAGNLHASMEDWLKFLTAHLLLGMEHRKDTGLWPVHEPVGPPVVPNYSPQLGYGLGWVVRDRTQPLGGLSYWAKQKLGMGKKAQQMDPKRVIEKMGYDELSIFHDGSNGVWLAQCVVDFGKGRVAAFATNVAHTHITLGKEALLRDIYNLAKEQERE